MKKFWIAICFLLGLGGAIAAPLQDLSSAPVGRIEFWSSTPEHRWRLANPKTSGQNPVVIWGDLLMPPNAGGKVPAVIVHHGSEGVTSLYYDVWAPAFLKAGYAVFIVDSQKPRGVERQLGNLQLSWNTVGNISDVLHSLKILATHPRIDASRIFNIGFSRGASAVLQAVWPFYQRALLPDDLHFAGSVAVYPGCNIRYRADHWGTNPGPLLLLLAEKDNMTPAQPCVEYAELLHSAGNDVSAKVYPGAYHVFDRLDQRFSRNWEGTFADCSLTIKMTIRQGDPFEAFDHKTGVQFSSSQQWNEAIRQCGREKQISVESNPRAREQAVKDVLQFIDRRGL